MSNDIGILHHIELWVPDLHRAGIQWGWLLTELGYQPFQEWTDGRSWRLGETYLVVEQSPALTAARHDRQRPGLNHIAFRAGDRARVDSLTCRAGDHGWAVMFTETHPHPGDAARYTAHLTNSDGYEVALVATES